MRALRYETEAGIDEASEIVYNKRVASRGPHVKFFCKILL